MFYVYNSRQFRTHVHHPKDSKCLPFPVLGLPLLLHNDTFKLILLDWFLLILFRIFFWKISPRGIFLLIIFNLWSFGGLMSWGFDVLEVWCPGGLMFWGLFTFGDCPPLWILNSRGYCVFYDSGSFADMNFLNRRVQMGTHRISTAGSWSLETDQSQNKHVTAPSRFLAWRA